MKICSNCFCYVCDSPAIECKEWREHAQATQGAPMWQDMRAATKAATRATASVAARSTDSGGRAPDWPCDKILKVNAARPNAKTPPIGTRPPSVLTPL